MSEEKIPIPDNFKKEDVGGNDQEVSGTHEPEEILNTGFNSEKELLEQSEKDWVFGGLLLEGEDSTPTTFDNDLPTGEVQNRGGRDKMTCTNNGGFLGPYQTLMNNKFRRQLFSDRSYQWLKEKGYIDDNNHFNGSERFNAITSGTSPTGNSLKAPYEAARKYGIIPEKMFPYVADYGEYFDKTKITQEMYDLGKEFLKHFPFNYEKVYKNQFDNVLKYSPIGVAGYAWPEMVNGIYQHSYNRINHAFNLYKLKYFCTDTYKDRFDGDYIKQLAPDYRFLGYGYRPIIREVGMWKTKTEGQIENKPIPKGTWLNSLAMFNWKWIKKVGGLFSKK